MTTVEHDAIHWPVDEDFLVYLEGYASEREAASRMSGESPLISLLSPVWVACTPKPRQLPCGRGRGDSNAAAMRPEASVPQAPASPGP